jgi:hypothetical protein
LFAAGAVALESWIANRFARACVFGVLIVAGAATLPIALPILPPEAQIRYARALGLGPSASATERGAQSALPQYLADMFGWRNMAAQVAKAYKALPEADREKAVFFGRNYGEAAAIDIYGPALGGPPAISAHNSYYLWGPGGHDGSVVITLDGNRNRLAQEYGDVRIVGRVESPYAMPQETNVPIVVLRSPREPLDTIWPRLKHYE